MHSVAERIKNEWKTLVVAVWMIGVTAYLVYMNAMVQDLTRTAAKLTSDVGSIESILISTDGNVSEMKQRLDAMSAKVDIVHQRVRRR